MEKKQNIFLALILLIMIAVLYFAAVSHAAESYVTTDWVSKYVIGSGFVNYDGPDWQAELGGTLDNGIGGSVWASIPADLKNVGKNLGTEVDLNGWYPVSKHITFGVAYFFLSPDLWGKENDAAQLNAEVDGSPILFGNFSMMPGFRTEYVFPVDGGPYNKFTTGLYLIPMVNLKYSVNKNLEISMNTKFTADLGGFGAEKALIVKLAPRATYQTSKHFSVNVGMDIYIPTLTTEKEERANQYVSHAGVGYKF